MFDPARPRPALRELILSGNTLLLPGSPVDIARLVSCCPGIKQLDITGVCSIQLVLKEPSLKQLSSLTSLSLSVGDDMTAEQELAKLTQLHSLVVVHDSVTEMGLLLLTQLRQLTHLKVDVATGDTTRPLELKTDVSAQLDGCQCLFTMSCTSAFINALPHFGLTHYCVC